MADTTTSTDTGLAFVRRVDEPRLPPPSGQVGFPAWVRANLFSSIPNSIFTLAGIAFLFWVIPPIVRWAFIDAVWTGTGREDCAVPGAGACWAFIKAKFPQFMYGRYPIEERWRVNLTGILFLAGLIPMAIPRVPFKRENAVYMLLIFPLIAYILLVGGNRDHLVGFIFGIFVIAGLIAALVSFTSSGRTAPFFAGTIAPIALGVAVVIFILSRFVIATPVPVFGGAVDASTLAIGVCALVGLLAAILGAMTHGGRFGAGTIFGILAVAAVIIVPVLLALIAGVGLPYVETALWGGLLITLVVAIVGIVASMPLGILLALGRRSRLPIVKFFSVVFIEFVRGVPLITVLFMASVMLPLFLPPGVNFDKLLRVLIGVTLFTAAYLAEVVRGGLQAIPKGQYEAAQANGLKYWQMMRLVVLPQALKIVIPGLVNSFISLFKDTSLVLIVGLLDLLGIVQFNFTDQNWTSPTTPATGYVFAAVVFWIFCFSMSRYSIYTERRLNTGYRR